MPAPKETVRTSVILPHHLNDIGASDRRAALSTRSYRFSVNRTSGSIRSLDPADSDRFLLIQLGIGLKEVVVMLDIPDPEGTVHFSFTPPLLQ